MMAKKAVDVMWLTGRTGSSSHRFSVGQTVQILSGDRYAYAVVAKKGFRRKIIGRMYEVTTRHGIHVVAEENIYECTLQEGPKHE